MPKDIVNKGWNHGSVPDHQNLELSSYPLYCTVWDVTRNGNGKGLSVQCKRVTVTWREKKKHLSLQILVAKPQALLDIFKWQIIISQKISDITVFQLTQSLFTNVPLSCLNFTHTIL